MIAYLFAVLLAAAVLLHPAAPAQGAHRTGAPTRPAPPTGRHAGPVRLGWPELGQVTAGRHTGENRIVTDQALEVSAA